MKKIFLLFSVMVMLFTACGDKNAYTLTGVLPSSEYDGKTVVLQEYNMETEDFNTLDSTTVENGKFVFKRTAAETPVVRFVKMEDAGEMGAPVLFVEEPGNIDMVFDRTPSVKGTSINNQYQGFMDVNEEANITYRQIIEEYNNGVQDGTMTSEKEEGLVERLNELNDKVNASLYEFIKGNATNSVGELFFLQQGYMLKEEQQAEIIPELRPEFRQNERIKDMEERLQILQNSAVGKQYIDVTGVTPDGKQISLSDYAGKGKVVLIDFWASWCGPCIQEMPTVIEAYNRYKDKGFEIVGISLDENAAAWENKVKELKMTWPQMSDLKGWQSELSAPYAVNSIPHTILLDKEGKIIEKNLRGDKLLDKLAELLD